MIARLTVVASTYIIGSVDFDAMPAVDDYIVYRTGDTVLNLKVNSRVWNAARTTQSGSPEVILYVYGDDPEARKYIEATLLRASKEQKG